MNSLEKHRVVSGWAPSRAAIGLGLIAAAALPFFLSSCGKKKEEASKPAPAASESWPTPSKPVAAAPEMKLPPAETVTPTPATAPSAPATAERNPADAAVWQRWDHVADGLREIGLTVQPSKDPTHMAIIAGPTMGPIEARTVVKNVYRKLGGGALYITVDSNTGKPLAEATSDGVR